LKRLENGYYFQNPEAPFKSPERILRRAPKAYVEGQNAHYATITQQLTTQPRTNIYGSDHIPSSDVEKRVELTLLLHDSDADKARAQIEREFSADSSLLYQHSACLDSI
jgi:hypothetical protein